MDSFPQRPLLDAYQKLAALIDANQEGDRILPSLECLISIYLRTLNSVTNLLDFVPKPLKTLGAVLF